MREEDRSFQRRRPTIGSGGNQWRANGFLSKVTRLLSCPNEMGRQFHVNGITVIRQTRSVMGAKSGADIPAVRAGAEGAAP
jgi:hypothetical protein